MLTVGQKLWYVPHQRQGEEVEIAKVGRKWATTTDHWHPRIDIKTLHADGGGSFFSGRYWLSREQYEAQKALNLLWRDFMSHIPRSGLCPDGVTEHAIRQAAALLNIPLSAMRS